MVSKSPHKPLVPLFSTKNLDELPVQVQWFCMHLMHFHFSISHISGKDLFTADALSHMPTSSSTTSDEAFNHEVAMFVALIMQHRRLTESRFCQIA